MTKEIERKFLVNREKFEALLMTLAQYGVHRAFAPAIQQRYVVITDTTEVRIRRDEASKKPYTITVKQKTDNPVVRKEVETEITEEEYDALSALCGNRGIDKIRHVIYYLGQKFEVDYLLCTWLFNDQTLVLAEIELESADQEFSKPDWLGQEVTGDPTYKMANIAIRNDSHFARIPND